MYTTLFDTYVVLAVIIVMVIINSVSYNHLSYSLGLNSTASHILMQVVHIKKMYLKMTEFGKW